MDLLDFQAETLYFEENLPPEVEDLIRESAQNYAEGGGEPPLLEARKAAPASLTVLVALYRFYYYQHRLKEAVTVADQAMAEAARRLQLPGDWQSLDHALIGRSAMQSMSLLRFYLQALKAAGYLCLRLGEDAAGIAMLEKLAELDQHDRMGAAALLQVVRMHRAEE